jgi:hypothetical protein
MFNSSVLDVAVGLVFVYLLLSLMCTTVNEWISQLFDMRAATLREGIHRLLHAPPDGSYLIRPVDINAAAIVKRLNKLDDKLTVALGPLDADVKTLKDQFAAALQGSAAATPPAGLAAALAEKLSALLSLPDLAKRIDLSKVTPETLEDLGKLPKGNDLLRLNRALLSEAYPEEIASLADAFYNHPLIKALARPGRHPSYVPPNTFALAILDILNKGRALSATTDDRVAQLRSAIDSLPDSDVKRSLKALFTNGADSVEAVEQKLEQWYQNSMDRVSGWYKNKVQVWTVVVASVITILANADTVQIARNLLLNPVIREKIVEQAKNIQPPGAAQGDSKASAPTLTAEQRADLSSLTGWGADFRIFHRFEACADGLARGATLSEADCRTQVRQPSAPNTNAKLTAGWDDDSFPGSAVFSAIFFPWLWATVPSHFVGWIFSAIAASLGAPFWFDMLNRVMNVRAAGTSPNEKDSPKSKA